MSLFFSCPSLLLFASISIIRSDPLSSTKATFILKSTPIVVSYINSSNHTRKLRDQGSWNHPDMTLHASEKVLDCLTTCPKLMTTRPYTLTKSLTYVHTCTTRCTPRVSSISRHVNPKCIRVPHNHVTSAPTPLACPNST